MQQWFTQRIISIESEISIWEGSSRNVKNFLKKQSKNRNFDISEGRNIWCLKSFGALL